MAVQDWAISVLDLTWVVHDDDLSSEGFSFSWWVILLITSNVTSFDLIN